MAMSEEHKQKIREGRERAIAAKKAEKQKNAESQAETKVVEKVDKTEKKIIRRKTSFGPRLKLGVEGTIPNHKMKWCNDYNGELEDNLHNGWSFVGQDEVDVTNISFRGTDKDTGNRISRETTVGPNVRIRCYLMKIPNEIYEEIEQEGEALASALEKPIYKGEYGLGEHDYKGQTRITTT